MFGGVAPDTLTGPQTLTLSLEERVPGGDPVVGEAIVRLEPTSAGEGLGCPLGLLGGEGCEALHTVKLGGQTRGEGLAKAAHRLPRRVPGRREGVEVGTGEGALRGVEGLAVVVGVSQANAMASQSIMPTPGPRP